MKNVEVLDEVVNPIGASVSVSAGAVGSGEKSGTCGDAVTWILSGGTMTISSQMFRNCASLTAIHISKDVTKIGDRAFYDCKDLKDIYYKGSETEWDAIEKGKDNYTLHSATIHYKSVIN
ncbi:MAG: leucine-rich repeat domain-containing protein [Clostridiales bacterium]|nr:leucine-rich repeat domain-containing protein [Clostridiales bacterium]